jgi:nucleotidyltransferase substrate binding protein (TIGR01987 family)
MFTFSLKGNTMICMDQKLSEKTIDFINALDRLKEAVDRDWESNNDAFVRDALVQRFEITFDTAWKAVKSILSYDHNIDIQSPLNAIQEAYRLGIIDDNTLWLDMKNDRNTTSHIYREAFAVTVAQNIPKYIPKLLQLKEYLEHYIPNRLL